MSNSSVVIIASRVPLELTPLVDVSLMLVVFLLLSSGMVAPEDQHVPIDLPVTGSGESGEAVPLSLID